MYCYRLQINWVFLTKKKIKKKKKGALAVVRSAAGNFKLHIPSTVDIYLQINKHPDLWMRYTDTTLVKSATPTLGHF
jgi:hypothetical protein